MGRVRASSSASASASNSEDEHEHEEIMISSDFMSQEQDNHLEDPSTGTRVTITALPPNNNEHKQNDNQACGVRTEAGRQLICPPSASVIPFAAPISSMANENSDIIDEGDDEDSDSGFDLLRPLDPDQFQLHPNIFQPLSQNPQTGSGPSSSSVRRHSFDKPGQQMVGQVQIIPSVSISISRTSQNRFHLDPLSRPEPGPSSSGMAASASATSGSGLTLASGNGTSEEQQEEHRCEICQKSFTLRTNLMAHKRLHFGETGCPYCEKILSTVGNLRMHIINVHNADANNMCPPRRIYQKRQNF